MAGLPIDTLAELRALIAQGKGARVEFKSSFQKEVIENQVAFSNSRGGVVFVGVDDCGQALGAQVAAALDAPKRSVERWLKQLRLAKKIEFRGAPKNGGYYLLKVFQ